MIIKNKNNYRCKVFLKDAFDKKLFIPGAKLYGVITESTKTVFISPYKPATKDILLMGIVQESKDIEYQNPLLLNLSIKDEELTVQGFIKNQYMILPTEIVFMAQLYSRTPFNKSDMDILWNSKVLIIGTGSGGSKIALEMANAGVGNIFLADLDILECGNACRHEGDLFDTGKSKVELIAERIYRKNPAIQVMTYHEDIFERSLNNIRDIFKGMDLVIAATDKRDIQLLINDFTQRYKVSAVFGGCYEEALGGEVFFTLPDETMPCLACLRSGLKQPEILGEIDYSTAKGPEDYEGQPGLHASIDMVTNIEVLISLGILLRKIPTSRLARIIDSRRNFILIGGALAKGFYRFRKPFDIFYQPLSGPRKGCNVCQQEYTSKRS